ncbi:MAG: hypothetical protein EBU08_20640 [Micrococcales bacterium]|nr:hypothetical protein [Micrococcales bacterium]
MAKIAVIGAGSWGTTFAKVLVDAGNKVTLWSRRPELTEEINLTHRNGDYMPGINLPVDLLASSDIAEVLAGAEQVYIAVPSQSLRSNLEQWGVQAIVLGCTELPLAIKDKTFKNIPIVNSIDSLVKAAIQRHSLVS